MFNLSYKLFNIDWTSYSISKISINDILDILIVTYFIYKIILWIKETRAWALFKGVAIVIIMSAVASMFGLTTIWWILKTTINVGILAIIIIFQPELRRALEELGTGKFSALFANNNSIEELDMYNNSVEQILKALRILSNNGMGAIIIMERDVALGDIEKTGIKLDALVSAALIVNIFEDKTPLHDGAIIIKNNRIKSASCILPLTRSEIGKELGTRHRAAVGVSEVSDAYALIVSEETQALSIAHKGKIYLNLTREQIKQFIMGNKKEIRRKFALWRGNNENN